MAPTVITKQFGFSNRLGAIANVSDGDVDTYWAPLATDFASYPEYFFVGDPADRILNYGASFAALEFDFGSAWRVPNFNLLTETILTLGPTVLIGSDYPASSPADTLQGSDVFLAEYTAAQITGNAPLEIAGMVEADIRKRYLRFLQRSNLIADIAPTPGPANSFTIDNTYGGIYTFFVPEHDHEFVIEVWGGGASGGLSAEAQSGGASSVVDFADFTLTANGGVKASATSANSGSGAGTGGTASGGNVANTTGGNGGTPTPTSTAIGYSGKGGDAPSGGLGGDARYLPLVIGGNVFLAGMDGRAPGAGGSGRVYWYPSGDALYMKYPGGGSGGYSKSVFARDSGHTPPPNLLECVVGDGGVSSAGDGRGAQGRIRFSWT
jgi:hypothetical protein